MKNLILSAFIILGLASCGKKDNGSTTPTPTPTPTPTTKTFVKYKMNDTLYVHDLTTTECFINEYGLQVSAAAGNGGVSFEAEIPVGNGTFDILAAGGLDGHFIFYRPDGSLFAIERTSPGSSGTFTITKTKLISGTKYAANGTFSGTAVSLTGTTATITEGEFFDVRTN